MFFFFLVFSSSFLSLSFYLCHPDFSCFGLLLSTFLWTSHYLYLSSSPINLRIVVYKLQYSQNYTLFLSTNHINLCSFPIFLIMLWYGKGWSGNILYIFFRILYWILLWIYFSFIILMVMMKRHVTLQSHDMSHDVIS